MTEDGLGGVADLYQFPGEPRYRALLLGSDGRVLRMEHLPVGDDAEAVRRARAFVDGNAVELWDGVRFIEHFAARGHVD